MANYSREIGADGYERLTLQTASTLLTLIPEAGGKITQLVDKRSAYDWLWHNPVLPPKNAGPNADYARELDSGGWDEILFSIAPCHIPLPDGRRAQIADHGDVVGRPWALDRLSEDENGNPFCTLSVNGQVLDYEFRRKVRLGSVNNTVVLDYELRNTGSVSLPFYWCAHALFNAGTLLRLSVAGNPAIKADTDKQNSVAAGHWPRLCISEEHTVDLSLPFAGSAYARKVFVRSPDDGRVSLQQEQGSLSMQYDSDDFPWLGLWLNNCGWNGVGNEPYCNLGVEPATTPTDHLTDVLDEPALLLVEPGSTKCWSLSLSLNA